MKTTNGKYISIEVTADLIEFSEYLKKCKVKGLLVIHKYLCTNII